MFALAAAAQTQTGGSIAADTIWHSAQSPYVVTSDVLVQNGATLTIEAGTTVYMGADTRFIVQSGALKAIGTIQAPIKITSQKLQNNQPPAPGDWQQLTFSTGITSTTKLEYVQIDYGKGIVVAGASPTFNYLTIRNNQGAAITTDLAASPTGVGNQASGNDINAIVVPAGDISGAVTWGVRGIPYLVQSGTVSVGTAPKIVTVSPSSLQQGETRTVTLSGSRLTGLSQPTFDLAGLNAQVVAGGTDSQAQLQVTATSSATLGAVNLSLVADAGEAKFTNALIVIPTQPKLTSVAPTTLSAGQGDAAVTLNGQNFTNQSVAYLNEVALATTYISATEISAVVPNQTAAATKVIKLRTPNPAGGSEFVSNELTIGIITPVLSLTPATATFTNGTTKEITLTLSFAAPAGGLVVNLTSSTPSVASVPATVNFAEGEKTKVVMITALSVGNTTITASRTGHTSATSNLIITPPPSLSISPASLNLGVGRTSGITVTSSVAAGAGGLNVSLASSDPSVATVSSSITIAANMTTATATINPLAVGTTTISAQASGYVTGATLVTVHGLTLGLPAGAVVSPGATRSMALTLSDPAPAGGLTVNLQSSNTAVLTVPASMTVAEGQTTANITLTGVGVGSATLTVSADNYQSATSTITVANITISLGTSSISLPLEGTSTHDVTLSQPAPVGGVVVNLAIANGTIASVTPATVSIPAGQTNGGAVKATVKGIVQGTTTLTASAPSLNASTVVDVAVSGQVVGIDLVVSNVTLGALVANQNGSYSLPVTYTVTNNGSVTAQPTWYDMAYLSANGVLETGDQTLSNTTTRSTALAPGASYTVTLTVTTSTATVPGAYTLFVKTDGHAPIYSTWLPEYGAVTDNGRVAEANETNNVVALPVTLSLPDLALSNVTLGTLVANQDGSYSLPVTYTVTNNGSVTAQPTWYDMAYLSTNGVLETGDQTLSNTTRRSTALAPGASYTVTLTVTTSTATAPGAYTLFVKTDGHAPIYSTWLPEYGAVTDNGRVAEANEANNVVALPVTLVR